MQVAILTSRINTLTSILKRNKKIIFGERLLKMVAQRKSFLIFKEKEEQRYKDLLVAEISEDGTTYTRSLQNIL